MPDVIYGGGMGFGPSRAAVSFLMIMLSVTGMALDPRRPLRDFGHQTWQGSDGLPQNSIHSILQTHDGYLWFATEGGLVRFNSTDFTVFNTENTPQLKSNFIRSLFEDNSGALWLSTSDGVVRYRDHQFTRFSEDDGLPSNAVWLVLQQRSGRVIAATAAGLAVNIGSRWQPIAAATELSVGSQKRVAEMPDGSLCIASGAALTCLDRLTFLPELKLRTLAGSTPGPEINALAADHNGRLWVGTKDGLEVLNHSKLTPVELPLSNVEVNSVLVARDQTVWLGTSQGLAYRDGEQFTFVDANSKPADRIESLFEDREGTLWVGTDHGAARLQKNGGQHRRLDKFPAANSLSSGTLLAAFEDREGNQWLGTESEGVTVLREQEFTTYTAGDGLSGSVIRSIAQSSDGEVWIGTDGGGLDRQTPSGFSSITTNDGLSSDVVLSIAPALNGDVWVGTPSGLNLIHSGIAGAGAASGNAGKIRILTPADGLADDYIRSLYIDGDGSLWIGTRHGLSHRQADATVNYSAMDGLGSDYIGAILRGRNGDLWICTSAGLTRMRQGRFRNFSIPSVSGNSPAVTTIYEDSTGILWLGSTEGGLYRMGPDDGRVQSIRDPQGALPASVFGILEDSFGHLWLSSKTGIYRVVKSDLDESLSGSGLRNIAARNMEVRSYGTSDGMMVRECSSGGHPAVGRMLNGTLWFATLRGVAVAKPSPRARLSAPPLMAIEETLVDDRQRDQQNHLELAPGNHRIEFRYTGLSFAAPLKVSYRYKLDGFDSSWVDAGNSRTAFYTNLPPGHYTFRVRAADQDGAWSQRDATLAMRIHPYFYQATWFWLALGISGTLLIWLLYRWRLQRVESTFTAVLGERNRIAREIHDTLAQGIVSISLQLEVVSRLLGTSTDAARLQLDRTRGLVRQSLADARSSIWELRSQESDAPDLPARIRRAVHTIEMPAGTQLHLQITGTYRAVDARIEQELFRIAQEAVANAVRHAQAKRIDVVLAYDEVSVALLVKDDGRGFARDHQNLPATGHFGIQGMRERAEGIGGVFEIDSRAEGGTLVSVKVSL